MLVLEWLLRRGTCNTIDPAPWAMTLWTLNFVPDVVQKCKSEYRSTVMEWNNRYVPQTKPGTYESPSLGGCKSICPPAVCTSFARTRPLFGWWYLRKECLLIEVRTITAVLTLILIVNPCETGHYNLYYLVLYRWHNNSNGSMQQSLFNSRVLIVVLTWNACIMVHDGTNRKTQTCQTLQY